MYGRDNFSSTGANVLSALFWDMNWKDCRRGIEAALLSIYHFQQEYDKVTGHYLSTNKKFG